MSKSKRRQLVVIGAENKGEGGSRPLGVLKDVQSAFANHNTCADGAPDKGTGTQRWHGPGMVVEVSSMSDPVTQALASVNEEDIAFPVLMRLCKANGWRMMDVESGRIFG